MDTSEGRALQGEGEACRDSLSKHERRTLTAIFERMFPSDDYGAGATEIGVVSYLERSLESAYRNWLPSYRAGLGALDEVVLREYGRNFVSLTPDDQDRVLERLEQHRIPEVDQRPGPALFDLLWDHLREGLFADPIHGGNRGMLGWRLIGFPGAQYGYSAEDQELDFVINREPRSVSDLRGDSQTRGGASGSS